MEANKGNAPEERVERELQVANIIIGAIDILVCLIVITLHFI